jgi:hypothetical protein
MAFWSDAQLASQVQFTLAGMAAEQLLGGVVGPGDWEYSPDGWDATEMVKLHSRSAEEAEAYLALQRIRVRHTLETPLTWCKVEALATALLARKRLTQRKAREVVHEAERREREIMREEARSARQVMKFNRWTKEMRRKGILW